MAALVTVALLWGSPASAQPLAEIARREAARRQRVQEPAKTYTNDDLRPYPRGVDPPPATDEVAAEPAPKAAGDPTPSPDEDASAPSEGEEEPERDESYWRGRVGAARGQVQRNALFHDALEGRVNALTTEFVNTDDPAQRALVAIDRQKAQSEMERVEAELERLRGEIAQITEEARRAGVPPGWLR